MIRILLANGTEIQVLEIDNSESALAVWTTRPRLPPRPMGYDYGENPPDFYLSPSAYLAVKMEWK